MGETAAKMPSARVAGFAPVNGLGAVRTLAASDGPASVAVMLCPKAIRFQIRGRTYAADRSCREVAYPVRAKHAILSEISRLDANGRNQPSTILIFVATVVTRATVTSNSKGDAMRNLRMALFVLSTSLVPGVHAAANSPFNGTWNLQVTAADKAPRQVRCEVDDAGIRLSEQRRNGAGQPIAVTIAAKFDGKYYQVSGGPPNMTVAYQPLNARTIVGTIKEGGTVTAANTVAVSEDGHTLTIIYTRKSSADGGLEVTTDVWRKQ